MLNPAALSVTAQETQSASQAQGRGMNSQIWGESEVLNRMWRKRSKLQRNGRDESTRMSGPQIDLQSEGVGAARDEPCAGAGAAAAHGLVDGLPHAALVVQQRAPVHHDLCLPACQAAAALRPVCDDGQLGTCALVLRRQSPV